MFLRILLINLFLIFLVTFSIAETINDIKVTGNKRLSKESIIVFGQIDLNSDYDQNELNEILLKIYQD